MLPTLIPPCTLDPGDPCRDDEAYVVFYMRQRYKNLMAAITIPPTVRVVANDQIIK